MFCTMIDCNDNNAHFQRQAELLLPIRYVYIPLFDYLYINKCIRIHILVIN